MKRGCEPYICNFENLKGGENMFLDKTSGINHNLLKPEETKKNSSGVSSEVRTLKRRNKVEMSPEVKALLKLWLT